MINVLGVTKVYFKYYQGSTGEVVATSPVIRVVRSSSVKKVIRHLLFGIAINKHTFLIIKPLFSLSQPSSFSKFDKDYSWYYIKLCSVLSRDLLCK